MGLVPKTTTKGATIFYASCQRPSPSPPLGPGMSRSWGAGTRKGKALPQEWVLGQECGSLDFLKQVEL